MSRLSGCLGGLCRLGGLYYVQEYKEHYSLKSVTDLLKKVMGGLLYFISIDSILV